MVHELCSITVCSPGCLSTCHTIYRTVKFWKTLHQLGSKCRIGGSTRRAVKHRWTNWPATSSQHTTSSAQVVKSTASSPTMVVSVLNCNGVAFSVLLMHLSQCDTPQKYEFVAKDLVIKLNGVNGQTLKDGFRWELRKQLVS